MSDGTVLQVASLAEFFRDALHGAAAKQQLALDDHTEQYVVNVLTSFSRADAFFEQTPCGPRLKPLALMLAEAAGARTLAERQHALQRLGDVSLFVAGFFAHGFARKLVDVDYHIAMGGRAYGTLADSLRILARQHEEDGLRSITGEHYQGGHWLGSFAVYLLTNRNVR